MSQETMFAAIEKVMAERAGKTGSYTVDDKVLDVLSASPEPMSSREIKLVLMRLKQGHSQTTISTSIGTLIDLGTVEFSGKAQRSIRQTTHTVSLYRIASKNEA